jgi:glycine/serine hydroxymethyltransferase
MTAADYISKQEVERQPILSSINSIILQEDKSVIQEIGSMMGKEMILYKEKGYFKYGLASAKNYMSLHIMPIYGGSPLHEKYQKLLPSARFQKGCLNFKRSADVPLETIRKLFAECARVSIAAMLEQRRKAN